MGLYKGRGRLTFVTGVLRFGVYGVPLNVLNFISFLSLRGASLTTFSVGA